MKYKNYLVILLCALFINSAIFSAAVDSSMELDPEKIQKAAGIKAMQDLLASNRNYNYDETLYKNLQNLSGAGIGRAISSGIEKSVGELIYVVPNTVKAVYAAIAVRAAKVITGSLGVTSKSILIFSNDINTKFNQFCFTKPAMQDRAKRAADIAVTTDETAVDTHWQITQKYLNMSLDTACNYLKSNIGSYDKSHEFVTLNIKNKKYAVAKWRKILISLMHKLSIKNDEVIFNYMKQAIFDIESLKNYLNSCKSYKDMENNVDHVKKWVNALCTDLNSIASELDGEIGKINIAMKAPSNTAGGGSSLNRLADIGI